jgi:hypothetical protein
VWVLVKNEIANSWPPAEFLLSDDEAVGLRSLEGWKDLEIVFNLTHDLYVGVTRKRSSDNFPHHSRSVSNENSDFVHTPPEARQYGEAKPVWECSKTVHHARNLDLFSVLAQELLGIEDG